MNRIFTHFVEKAFALGTYAAKIGWTPNPVRPLTPQDNEWMQMCPDDFYAIPSDPPNITFSRPLVGDNSLYSRFRFPSAMVTPYVENNTVHGLANLRRRGKARGAFIILHGHAMTSIALLEYYARPAVRLGMDVYFMMLPYHMRRRPHGTWSGQYSLNADIRGSAMAFRQGVQDVRCLINWIEKERHEPVVLGGVSLGAFTSLMTAVVDDRPKAVVSILGGGSLAQIIWDGYQLGRSKRQLQQVGVTADQLERDWALLGPANWQPKVDPQRVLLLNGLYDPIVTPENTNRLWQAWGKPEIHWYPGGHASIAPYNRQVKRELFLFLASRL
jgi:hypothetical protein